MSYLLIFNQVNNKSNTISCFTEQVTGHDWKVANAAALKLAESDKEVGFIHPYDHPEIW